MKLGPLAFPVARLVFGVFLISFSSVFVKLVGSVGPAAIGFYRCLIGALILLPFVWCNPYRQMSRRTLVFLILGGFAFAMDLTFWHRSIHIVGVGLGTLLAVTQLSLIHI